jgi:hypothetical protein
MEVRYPPLLITRILFSVMLVAGPAIGGPLQDFQAMGSGAVVTNCPGRLAPNCTIRTEGTSTATADGVALLDGIFDIRFDTGSVVTPNGWPAGFQQGTEQGVCVPGSHLGFLVGANGDVLRFTNVGLACEETAPGSPVHFNGTFRITGGTGQFATAVGAGNVVVTTTRTDSLVFVKMIGTIAY